MTFSKNKACVAMGNMISSIQASLARERRLLQTTEGHIQMLQKQVPPNTTLIQEFQSQAETLVKQIAKDSNDLQAFQDEFNADCGPGPH